MVQKNGMILMTAFMFAAIIIFVVIGLSPVQKQTTSILAIVPSSDKNHSIIFQICSDDVKMRAPEIKISSDLEEKKIKLSNEILPNSCRQTSAIIKASDSKTIQIEKVDKKNINLKITEIENEIQQARSKIDEKNKELEGVVDSISENRPANKALNERVNDITLELVKLRNELQNKKIEHDKLLILLKNT